ncbi:MAG: ABC transporter ATP-binding protein [Clostridia bacterium]|nr:ABC transporter ATP-binding protein [Clostridia bacterium]
MKKWMPYVRPYRKYFICGPLCMIVEVLGEIFMPKLFGDIINNGIADKNVGYVLAVCGLMILCALIMLAGGVGGAYFGAKASVNFAADVRKDVYKKVQKFSFSNLDKFSTGSLVTRLTNDITQLQNFVNMLLRMCLRVPGMLIGAVIMAVIINPRLSIVLAVAMPVILGTQAILIRIAFPRFNQMQKSIDRVNANIQESITNIRVVKSFVREDFENRKFGQANRDLKTAGMRAMQIMIFMQPLMMLFMNLTTIAVIWFGGRQIVIAGMLPGDLISFVNYITQILMSLMFVTMLFMMSSRAMASAKRIKEVLNEKEDITDTHVHTDIPVADGSVVFENVNFKYQSDGENDVLEDINFSIRSAETVGIIGTTGCGKTTLVSLLPRLYDVDSGEVRIGGVNVKDYKLKTLRDAVSVVLQKNVLFSGSIADNLRWGDENASDEEMRAAAEAAAADGFVRSFKDGYETQLGQGGSNVSGGQKQRLCIARALLKKPKVLILDDSTSAVDTATEALIRRSFKTTLKDVTKIIIAQRIGSVVDSDKIIVMNDGRITGIGTHAELLENNADYKEIYESQIEKEAKQ